MLQSKHRFAAATCVRTHTAPHANKCIVHQGGRYYVQVCTRCLCRLTRMHCSPHVQQRLLWHHKQQREKEALSNDRPVPRHTPRPDLLPTQLLSRNRKQLQLRCGPCRRSSVSKHTPWPTRGNNILRTAIDNAISRQFHVFLTRYQAHRESGRLSGRRRGRGGG